MYDGIYKGYSGFFPGVDDTSADGETQKGDKKERKIIKSSLEEIQGTAAAILHFTTEDFENCSPIEIFYSLKAHAEERERSQIFELEKMRLHLLTVYNMNVKEIDRIEDPRKILLFSHDEKPEDPEDVYFPTPDEWEEMDARVLEIHKQKERE